MSTNNKIDKGHLISVAAAVGVYGDLSLQILSKCIGGKTGWGLNAYFRQHGVGESLFVAGGMMAIFYMIYIYALKLPITVINLAIYGIVWDILFRGYRLFNSLDGYYNHLGIISSAFWGAIPMIAPYIIYTLYKGDKIQWFRRN